MNKYNDFLNSVQKEVALAYKTSLETLSNKEIFHILTEDNDDIKPLAIINLKNIETKNEAEFILSYLTGHDGRIREAVSYILAELSPENFLLEIQSLKILVQGILDINPNVSRNIVELIKNSIRLKSAIEPYVLDKIRNTIKEFFICRGKLFIKNREKSHALNKLTFNLYWLLAAISVLNIKENIEDILRETSNFTDYTIREKTALILAKMENPPKELLIKLKNDKNIYVKNQLLC